VEFEYLGPYKIDTAVGQGGMGTVYKAHHAKSGDVVAVKVIADSIANQERFRRRFDAEIESLERLTNKFIVKLIGYGEERGRLFYSMEYVEGETLQEQIKRLGKLDWEVTLRYGMQICFALKHAHDIGVIHRDLKPANLLIDKDDNIKVTDFGIAKLYGGSDETVLGSVLGTADFMPPEQAEGTRVTTRSDLYALGAVLYTCLSGKSPHYAKTTPETLYNVRYKIPSPLRERYENIPRELDILILELLEKDPKKRPPTALVVWNRLSAMQAGLTRLPHEAADQLSGDKQQSHNIQGESQDSMELSDIDEHLAHEIRKPERDGLKQVTREDVTKEVPDRNRKTYEGLDLTLASEDLIEASHMGHTTNIATHLTSLPNESSGLGASSDSTFTVVQEGASKRRKTVFNDDEEEDERSWTNIISIAILSLGILGCLGGIYYASRPPSADALYGKTVDTVENASSLETINAALTAFKAAYPDDPRLKEFTDVEGEVAMQQMISRLSRRVKRSGGSAVSPIELAFVGAMQLRDQNVSQAIQELRDFVTVFQDPNLLDPDERELVEYASRELQRLTASEIAPNNQEEDLLRGQLQAALLLDAAKRRAYYESVIRLYSDKPSAKPLVMHVQQLLDELKATDKR
jgi:serine/threonine-protein kinase